MKRFNKLTSSIVLMCFIWNTAVQDYAFGLATMPGSTQSGTRSGMFAAGQKELATREYGPGSDIAVKVDEYESKRFVGNVPHVEGLDFVPSDYIDGMPKGWKKNELLKNYFQNTGDVNLIDALKYFRENEANLTEDQLEIVEGDFKLEKGKSGEIPICRIERDDRTFRYRLVMHKNFVRMWADIKKNDVWFKYRFPDGRVRTVSLAWAIFYRIAKHEMTDLESRDKNGRRKFTPKSRGHMEYLTPMMEWSNTLKVNEDETTANAIRGRYAIINDGLWMWFLGSYCFGPATQYNDATFKDRALWFMGLYQDPKARAKAEEWNDWAVKHKLPDEFPNLLNDAARAEALGIARAVNKKFYTNYRKYETPVSQDKEEAMARDLADREPHILKILPVTGKSLTRSGKSSEDLERLIQRHTQPNQELSAPMLLDLYTAHRIEMGFERPATLKTIQRDLYGGPQSLRGRRKVVTLTRGIRGERRFIYISAHMKNGALQSGAPQNDASQRASRGITAHLENDGRVVPSAQMPMAVEIDKTVGARLSKEAFDRLFAAYSVKAAALSDIEKNANSSSYKALDLRNKTMLALENLRMDSEAVRPAPITDLKPGDIVLNLDTKAAEIYNGSNILFTDATIMNYIILRPLSITAHQRVERDNLLKTIRNFDGKNDRYARMAALRRFNEMLETGILPKPVMTEDIFMHCHSPYSHSPGHTPEYIAVKGKLLGLKATGLVDHDTAEGVSEFLEAAEVIHLPNPSCGNEKRGVFKNTPFEFMTTNSPGNIGETYIAFHGLIRDRNSAGEEKIIAAKIKRFTKTLDFINSLNILPRKLTYEADVAPRTEKGNPTEKHVAEAISQAICSHFGCALNTNLDKFITCANALIAACDAVAGTKTAPVVTKDLESEDPFVFTNTIRKKIVTVIKGINNGAWDLRPTNSEVGSIMDLVREARENGELPWYLYLGGEKPCQAEDRTPLTKRQRLEKLAEWKAKGYGMLDQGIVNWWLNLDNASMLHLYFRFLKVTCGMQGVMLMPNRNSAAEIEEVTNIAHEAGFEHVGNGMDVNSEMPFTYFRYSNRPDFARESLAVIEYEKARRAEIVMPEEVKQVRLLIEKARKESMGDIKVSIRSGDRMVYADSGKGILRMVGLNYTAEQADNSDISLHLAAYRQDPKMTVIIQSKPATIGRFINAGKTVPAVTPDFIALLQQKGELVSSDKTGRELEAFLAENLKVSPKQPKAKPEEPIVLKGHSVVLTKEAGVFAAGANPLEAYYRAKVVEDSAKTVEIAEGFGKVNTISDELAARLLDSDFEKYRIAMAAGLPVESEKLEAVTLNYNTEELEAARNNLTEIGRKIAAEDLVVGPGGNTSACIMGRDAAGNAVKIMLIKASGNSFENMGPEKYIGVTIEEGGRMRLVNGLFGPKDKPSTEVWSHRAIYLKRPDVMAIVHTHAPIATGLATAERTFKLGGKNIGLIPYVHPGKGEMPEAIEKLIADHDALLITNHGAITVAATLDEAYRMTIVMEDMAKTIATRNKAFAAGADNVQTTMSSLVVDRNVEEKIMGGMATAMNDGLAGQPSSLKMGPSYVGAATGEEEGDYFAIDVGGTNLRVLGVHLEKGKKPSLIGIPERMPIPNSIIKGGTAEELFGLIVTTIKKYVENNNIDSKAEMKFGLTWSFPVKQTGVASGICDPWTKGWDISGVVGQDPVLLLKEALTAENVNNVRIMAMCNDTVGTLMFGDIGLIFGSGTNAAFTIAVKDIGKFKDQTNLEAMAINSEWGNFDGVPTKAWDDLLDSISNNPGRQKLEKMISGMYLGDVDRHIINLFILEGKLFGGRHYPIFDNRPKEPGIDGFTIEITSKIRKVDPITDPDLTGIETILAGIGVSGTTLADRRLIRDICNAVSLRAAKVSATALAAVIKKSGVLERKEICRVAIDGGVFKYHYRFKEMMEETLAEIFGAETAGRIKLELVEDGSGVGAAMIAAVVDRSEKVESKTQKAVSPRTLADGIVYASPVTKPLSASERSVLDSIKDDAARIKLMEEIWGRELGGEASVVTMAPGRDNWQGEHVDYNKRQFKNGKVHLYSMGGAIPNNFIALTRTRTDGEVRVIHADAGEQIKFDIKYLEELQKIARLERELNLPRTIPEWVNHALGMLMEARRRGCDIKGMDIMRTSNIPAKAGLSNSAANCCALAMAINEEFKLGLDLKDLAQFAQAGEHDDFIGSTCGLLDQTISLNGKKGSLALIDYADMSVKVVQSKLPEELKRVLIDTSITHELATTTEYNDRNNVELLLAWDTLAELLPGREIEGSTSLTLNEINKLISIFDPAASIIGFEEAGVEGIISAGEKTLQMKDALPSDILDRFKKCGYKIPGGSEMLKQRHGKLTREESFALCLRRMRHQLTSGLRTPLTALAAERGDVKAFGRLINAEGESLKENGDFQITGKNGAQDALLKFGIDTGKELGIDVFGRMEGGGGGGYVGFFVDSTNAAKYSDWCKLVKERYQKWYKKAFKKELEEVVVKDDLPLSAGARVVKSPTKKKTAPAPAHTSGAGVTQGGVFFGAHFGPESINTQIRQSVVSNAAWLKSHGFDDDAINNYRKGELSELDITKLSRGEKRVSKRRGGLSIVRLPVDAIAEIKDSNDVIHRITGHLGLKEGIVWVAAGGVEGRSDEDIEVDISHEIAEDDYVQKWWTGSMKRSPISTKSSLTEIARWRDCMDPAARTFFADGHIDAWTTVAKFGIMGVTDQERFKKGNLDSLVKAKAAVHLNNIRANGSVVSFTAKDSHGFIREKVGGLAVASSSETTPFPSSMVSKDIPTVIDEYAADPRNGYGPGILEPLDIASFYPAVNMLEHVRVEVYLTKGTKDPLTKSISEDIKRINIIVRERIRKHTGRKDNIEDPIKLLPYNSSNLNDCLGRKGDNVRRIFVNDLSMTADFRNLADPENKAGADLLRGKRVITMAVPDGRNETESTVNQAWLLKVTLLSALLDESNTLTVGASLEDEIKGRIFGDPKKFVENMAKIEDDSASNAAIRDRVNYFLLPGSIVKLSAFIGEQLRILKAFWVAA